MSKIDDGGPAFPNPGYNGNWDDRRQIEGMSLRDWFAGQALVGLIAQTEYYGSPNQLARNAYSIAGAMVKASKASE